jgi:hypothetical protein
VLAGGTATIFAVAVDNKSVYWTTSNSSGRGAILLRTDR